MKRRKEKVRFTVTTRIALFPPLFRSQLVITSHGAARRGDELPPALAAFGVRAPSLH